MNKNEPHIQEQPQISKDHQEMISDLQSIVKDLKDLYRNADPNKKEEKDNDIEPLHIKMYDKDKSGNKPDITLGIKNDTPFTNDIMTELLYSIKNDNILREQKINNTNIKQKYFDFYNLEKKIKSLTITRDNGDKDTLEFGTPPRNRKIQNITVCKVPDTENKYIVFEYTSEDYNQSYDENFVFTNTTTPEQFKTSRQKDHLHVNEEHKYKLVIDLTNNFVYNHCTEHAISDEVYCCGDLERFNSQKKIDTSNLYNHFRNPFFIVPPKTKNSNINDTIKKDIKKQLNEIFKYILFDQTLTTKDKENLIAKTKGTKLHYKNLIERLQQVNFSLGIAQQLIKQGDQSYAKTCYEYALILMQNIIEANTSWTIMDMEGFKEFKRNEGIKIITNIKQKINNLLRGFQELSWQPLPSLRIQTKPKKYTFGGVVWRLCCLGVPFFVDWIRGKKTHQVQLGIPEKQKFEEFCDNTKNYQYYQMDDKNTYNKVNNDEDLRLKKLQDIQNNVFERKSAILNNGANIQLERAGAIQI